MKIKREHEEWLEEFLQNCKDSNKSEHTLINYRCDLVKFITWFEKRYKRQLLNEANAQTISDYTSYITNSQNDKVKTKNKNKKDKKPANLFTRMGSFFGRIFKKEQKREALPSPTPTPVISGQLVALAVSSRRRHLSAIKNFYEYLKQSNEDDNDLFTTNPVKPKLHSIKLKDSDVEPTKLLTPPDWQAITQTVRHPREVFIVNILYFGGLRLSELCSLRLSHFEREKGCLTFTRKGGYVHTLFLQNPKKIFAHLDDYLAVRNCEQGHESDYIFSSKRSRQGPLTSRAMYNLIMNIFKRSNCPTLGLTPHSFRKACASNLYHQTKDLLFVRDYLNHADAKVTQTYIETFEQTHAHGKKGY